MSAAMKTYPWSMRLRCLSLCGLFVAAVPLAKAANPAIMEPLTADPAALVHDGKVYLYTGHDEAAEKHHGYVMKKWLVFSSTDMVTWTEHPSPMNITDFPWAKENAWAGHVVEKGGKFYWYVPVSRGGKEGFAIGVAVADNPLGPFKDARGSALIVNEMTTDVPIGWDDIDPAAFIDDNGQAYLFWGNQRCRYVKLKPNMTEFEGEIVKVDLPNFTEAPYIHKKGDTYYLTYATGFPEKVAYATSKKITGPWEYRGLLAELAGNSNTIHQSIITYKGRDYFIYHNGGTPLGGSFRRSVCIDYLYYNPDGTLKRVVQTSEGVAPATE
jgi:beta-xylosidase